MIDSLVSQVINGVEVIYDLARCHRTRVPTLDWSLERGTVKGFKVFWL